MDIPIDIRKGYLERRFADLKTMKNSLGNPDFALFKKLGHQIRGNAKSFDFDDLTVVAIAFEKAAESRNDNALLSAVSDFEMTLNLCLQRLASEETISDK